MMSISNTAIIAMMVATLAQTAAAEQMATVKRETFACTSWAAWHEYGQASLTAKGVRMNKLCPIRIPAKTKVTVVEDDAGEGATEVSYQGKNWFVDNQNLQ